MTLRLDSLRYRLPEADLLGFPFTSADGKQTATIVLQPGANEGEKQAAEQLAEYFRYYYASALDQPLAVNLEVREGVPGAAGPQVVLDGTGQLLEGKPALSEVQVRRRGEQLTVTTAKPELMLPAVRDLLRQLDHRYVYPGDLPWRYHTNALGMVGKYVGLDGQVHGHAPAR